MKLIDTPLLMATANWIWGADPAEDVTPEICLDTFPFMSSGCLSRLIVKGLGIAIILGACLNKAPVMFNLMKSKSAEGMSVTALYGEIIMYLNASFYSLFQGYPITAYGENMALAIQTVILVLMCWQLKDDPKLSMNEKIIVWITFGAYVFVVTVLLPTEMEYLLMASIWPVLLYSRGSQILVTYRAKHTGCQSILTMTMNLAGAAVRILTTIKEVGWDMNVLLGHFLSVALNFIMFAQYWIYRSNTEKFHAELAEKKQA